MSDDTKQLTIAEQIDADQGLKAQRRKLVTVSVILLGIQFTGLDIVEANTFFFKMKFENQNGLALFLAISILFLMVRYYNYASRYHKQLFESWSYRMLGEQKYWYVCPHSHDAKGVIWDMMPPALQQYESREINPESNWEYSCKFPFRRAIKYYWHDQDQQYDQRVSIFKSMPFPKYLNLLQDEFRNRVKSVLIDRIQLDIVAPYFLGSVALLALLFESQLSQILN